MVTVVKIIFFSLLLCGCCKEDKALTNEEIVRAGGLTTKTMYNWDNEIYKIQCRPAEPKENY